MKPNGIGRSGLILVLCLASAAVCAFVYTVIVQFTLPPTDLAYGRGLSFFTDPFVLGGTVFWAILAGLFAFPFALYCLRDRSLFPCYLFVSAVVLTEICIVTPLSDPLGFLGSFPTVLGALLFCKFSNYRLFRQESETHRSMNAGGGDQKNQKGRGSNTVNGASTSGQ